VRQSATALLWLALLALLPGCALFGGGSASDEPRKIYDRRDQRYAAEMKERKDAGPEKTEVLIEPTAKLLQSAPTVGPEIEPNAKPGVLGIATMEPNKHNPGTTGIVTIERMVDSLGVSSTAAQGPPPLPPLDKKSELAPLTQAIQLMLDGRHQDAILALRPYDEETQQFFLRMLPPLTVIAKTPISKLSPQDIAVMEKLLYNLQYSLRTRCELLVNRMHYCKEIYGFAQFDAWPENHAFLNASKDRSGEQVLLYVELKNFASVKGDDGAYLTKLSCSLALQDSNGKEVWKSAIDPKQTTYRPSACLNDYHGKYSFYVPPIPAGTYKLTLQIIDETIPNERRIARKSLDFRVTPVANQTTLK
jgi:hypothetical protein